MKKTKKNQPSRDPSNGGRVIDDGPLAPLVKAIGTLPELADLAGMSVTTLRRINRGDREPRAGERVLFSTLAKRFHVATPFPRSGRGARARRPRGEAALECAYAHVLVERAALRAAGEIDADQFDDEMRALVARAMCEDPGERGLEILAALGVE